MPLSEANNNWNRKALEEAAAKRKFIREAVEAGFTEKQAEFMFGKNQEIVTKRQ